jgi:hypothetical protein
MRPLRRTTSISDPYKRERTGPVRTVLGAMVEAFQAGVEGSIAKS